MLITTSGSDYWPKSLEGRVLCFLLALYAFAVFGYVTATLATLLLGHEAKDHGVAGVERQTIAALRADIAAPNDLRRRQVNLREAASLSHNSWSKRPSVLAT
jgi:voltage-gated potassium channel